MSEAHAAVRVPATTANLGAGFDSFGAALSLHLVACSVPREERRVRTTGEGAGEVDEDDGNLVWRALRAFCEHFGVPVPDVSVAVRNDVPLERGLGSSSAAIVAGLALGRALTGQAAADREVARLAADLEGHPDNVVPAMLGGLTCSASDADGRLVMRRAQPHPRLRPVLLVPPARQATTAARGVLPEGLPTREVAVQVGRAGHVLVALTGAWPADPGLAGDLLHEPVRLGLQPATGAVLKILRDGGVHAWLSGAGPSVAAAVPVVPDQEQDRVVERAAAAHDFAVHVLEWDLAGAVRLVDVGAAADTR